MPDPRALPRRSDAPAHAPWSDAEIATLERWQGDPRLHQLTCKIHSHIPLVPTRDALRCADANCDYIQTWVPGVCLLGGI